MCLLLWCSEIVLFLNTVPTQQLFELTFTAVLCCTFLAEYLTTFPLTQIYYKHCRFKLYPHKWWPTINVLNGSKATFNLEIIAILNLRNENWKSLVSPYSMLIYLYLFSCTYCLADDVVALSFYSHLLSDTLRKYFNKKNTWYIFMISIM